VFDLVIVCFLVLLFGQEMIMIYVSGVPVCGLLV
jgi:hypothetical protein